MKNIVTPLKLSTCATLLLFMNVSANAGECSSNECGSAGIGNRVWFDANKDGIQDEIEWHGVDNVKLSLTSCNSSTVLAEESLNKDGYYGFNYLEAGSYKVTAEIPNGYVFTQPKAGNDNDVDSDITSINGTKGSTDCIQINSNESVFTVDIGLTKSSIDLGSIGDTVFNDSNNNGYQDGTESGISGVTINLSDGWDNSIGSAVTDASGQYIFQNLAIQDDTNSDIGCYNTSVVVPTSGNFINATVTTDSNRWTCLDNGQYDTAHDYGLYKAGTGGGGLASIGDFFWHDINGDGVQDSGEMGIPNATLYLYDSNYNYVTDQTTDGSGRYAFTGLTQGCYWVDAETPSSGTFSSANFTTDSWIQACVQSGEQKINVDFGVNLPIPSGPVCTDHEFRVWGHLAYRFLTVSALPGMSGPKLFGPGHAIKKIDASQLNYLFKTQLPVRGFQNRTWSQPLIGKTILRNFRNDDSIDTEHNSIWLFNSRQNFSRSVSLREATQFVDEYLGGDNRVELPVIVQDPQGNRRAEKICIKINKLYTNITTVTPIAFDLNHDGVISTTGSSTARDADRSTLGATVKFDMFGNNQPIEMEWFAGDGDGILIDNRDGLAATQMNGTRLFGDQGGQFTNGYEQLALLDTNADAQLTGAELNGLLLWVDNGDAIVQTGELQSLTNHKIASIGTEMSMINGLMRSVATTTTGQSIMTEDVWFGFIPVPVAAPILSPATQVSLSKLGLFSGILALLGLMGWHLRKRNNASMSYAVK